MVTPIAMLNCHRHVLFNRLTTDMVFLLFEMTVKKVLLFASIGNALNLPLNSAIEKNFFTNSHDSPA